MMDHRQRIAQIALSLAGCSAHVNTDKYELAVIRPADRVEPWLGYYTGAHPPSTCALFACRVLAIAGMNDPEFNAHYRIGFAVEDLETVAARYGALHLGTPTRQLHTGDVIVIDDGSGHDAHVMVIVSDAISATKMSYQVRTVEGGQLPDSSGVGAFQRSCSMRDGRLYVGARYVVALIDSDLLPLGDDALTDDTHHTNA